MQIFTATVVETRTRTRRFQLAANTPEDAAETARAVLREGGRVVEVRPYGARAAVAAKAAIDRLITRDFLPRGAGIEATVEDWILATLRGEAEAATSLALAGLRIEEGRIIIGSPTSVPTLARWFQATPWAGGELLSVLMLIDGAARTSRTFAGVSSRAVSLPLSAVIALEEVPT